MKRRLALAVPLLLVALLLWKQPSGNDPATRSIDTGTSGSEVSTPDVVVEFGKWLAKPRADQPLDPAELQTAVALAKARHERMLEWITRDPEGALRHAVSWSEYHSLPEEVRAFVERPFNATGELRVLPDCGGRGHQNLHEIEIDGITYSAGLFGRRLGQSSKQHTPLAGILLAGRAAIAEGPVQILTEDDLAALPAIPLGNPDARRDFATGEALVGNPVTALAGGKRYLFNHADTVARLNEKLAALDHAPGPHGGSQLVFKAAKTSDGAAGISWETIERQNIELASAWTETDKDVFFIRVDFPDKPGADASQATLDSVLNGPVADSIDEMSYGKTTILATVSADVITLPGNSSSYLADYDALHDDAVAGYKAAHGTNSLSGYDIIGVHFQEIGFSWAGLATIGGTRQWIEGTTNSGVIIHEFGHNYGLGHANLWQTNDGSVAGSGGSVEYGDPFDIMGDGPDPEGHFHMQAKSLLNWIDPSQWVNANTSGSGTYRIHRIDHGDTTGTLRGLRVNKGGSDFYWIGHRAGIPDNPWLAHGAYVVWQKAGFSRSWLLDMTPDSPDDEFDSALAIGKTYSDNTAGVHITPTAAGGSGADAWLDVNVQLGTFPGNQAPTANLDAPAAADARAGVTLSVAANDPNGDALAYHWDFGDESFSTNSPTVSHSWPTGGSYLVTVTVSDMKGGVVTDSTLVVVGDPLDTWTQRTSGTTANLYDITTDGSKLVAVGGTRGAYRISTDGSAWTGGTIWTSGNTANNLYLRGVIHDGGQFVSVGYDYDFGISSWTGAIYTSPNGSTWTRRQFSGASLQDIAFGNGIYIAVGNNGTMWRSVDGIAWSPVFTGISQNLQGAAFGDGTFVVVGDDGSGWNGVVLRSTDGTNWTNTTPTSGLTSTKCFYNIRHCNDRFVASGWNSAIRQSTDGGVTFAVTDDTYRLMSGLAFGNGLYFAAGVVQGSDTDINLLSTDGANWTPLATTGQNNRNAAVFFNDTFVTVGDGGSIWQSAEFTAPIAPPSGVAAWLEEQFPDSPPLSGLLDDFDHDGIPNLGEYATGTDPRDGGSRFDTSPAIDSGYLTLTVPKSTDADDVTVVVEHSTNLASWSTAGTTVIEDSGTQLVVKVTAPAGGGGNDFLRVRFTTTD